MLLRLVLLVLVGLGVSLPPGWSFSICGCGLDCACAGELPAERATEVSGCCGSETEPLVSEPGADEPCEEAAPGSCGDGCSLLVSVGEDPALHKSARAGRLLAHSALARLEPVLGIALCAVSGLNSPWPREAEREPPWERRDLPLRL